MFLSARMNSVLADVIVGRSLIPFHGAVPITSEQSDVQSVENLSRLAEHAYEGETWRTFVALELPYRVRRNLVSLSDEVPSRWRRHVRWVGTSEIHLTLKFLGEVDPSHLVEVALLMRDAAKESSQFDLNLDKTGAFPSPRRPNTLWVGFGGEVQRLMRLQARIEGSMIYAGVDVDPWRFHPHVTIGRLRRGPSAYMAGQIGYSWLDAWIPERGFDVHVTRITLFRSQLGPGGARYETLFTAPMA